MIGVLVEESSPLSLSAYGNARSTIEASPRAQCRAAWERLKGMAFAKVFTSPLRRAARTCELAGFGAVAETDRDLVEWNYGNYEGLTSKQILQQRPDWDLLRDGCPGGCRIATTNRRAVAARDPTNTERAWRRVALFLRALYPRIGRVLVGARTKWERYFVLSPASLSAVSYEHNLSRPVVRLCDDDRT